ncbi:MAG: FHA domain-containing protein [Clostridia bacterium]|nr:FHA domain-containing protein [Clostridia bacterium]
MAKGKIIGLLASGAVMYLGVMMILLFVSPVVMILLLVATLLAVAYLWRFKPEKLQFLSVLRRKPQPQPSENYRIEKEVFLSNLMLCSTNLQRESRIALNQKHLLIGSGVECDIVLPAESGVGSRHAVIRYRETDKQFYVEDAGSIDGTRLNGVSLQKGVEKLLRKGDALRFGTIEFVVKSAYYQ